MKTHMDKNVIKKLTAFVSIDEKGNEGVLAAQLGTTTLIPLIGNDEDFISLIPIAISISKHSGMPIRIIEFSIRRDITEEVMKKYDQ